MSPQETPRRRRQASDPPFMQTHRAEGPLQRDVARKPSPDGGAREGEDLAAVQALAAACEFTRDHRGAVQAHITIGSTKITWPLRSAIFKRWVAGQAHKCGLKPISDALFERALAEWETAASARRAT